MQCELGYFCIALVRRCQEVCKIRTQRCKSSPFKVAKLHLYSPIIRLSDNCIFHATNCCSVVWPFLLYSACSVQRQRRWHCPCHIQAEPLGGDFIQPTAPRSLPSGRSLCCVPNMSTTCRLLPSEKQKLTAGAWLTGGRASRKASQRRATSSR